MTEKLEPVEVTEDGLGINLNNGAVVKCWKTTNNNYAWQFEYEGRTTRLLLSPEAVQAMHSIYKALSGGSVWNYECTIKSRKPLP